MSRSERLLSLLQELRGHRRPVSGRLLAEATGVSLRTLYRDIASLQAQGANIQGEAGLGYVLAPGYLLPPLMFREEEIEALVLGSRWVAERADDTVLAVAARDALAKIAAVLPVQLREELDASPLLVGPAETVPAANVGLGGLRQAIRAQRKLKLIYHDGDGRETTRRVWPFALGFFERVRVLLAWCELRGDFRHFRVDRIAEVKTMEERYPQRRQALLKRWRQIQGLIPAP